MTSERTSETAQGAIEGIAIVGMSGRLPGARDLGQFWDNLQQGVESIEFPSDDDLRALGVDDATLQKPNYVKARAAVDDIDLFDASFFGINPNEARILDPQHRIFLETAWAAMENAGYDVESYDGMVGVYASASSSSYFLYNLFMNRELRRLVGSFQLAISNDREFLPTRVSYKLDLKGPSVNVQTACSSSLVAVHLGCQSLLNYQCDMCLAGGVSIRSSLGGYFYMQGGILSPDGHCRPFDAGAQGTIFGSGVGIVVLKRLRDAIEDGDRIRAIIRGSAINNDGTAKVGYTAPGVEGQTRVLAEAQAIAGVDPDTLGYVEAHGTATALGDPIEVSALTRVFRRRTERKQYCGLGSVKSNVGHLDAAAGVVGLIKTVMQVEHGTLVPSLHYREPNPEIDFTTSPFFVPRETSDWPTDGGTRRAGVSSFGIGGTNAHVIVESAPQAAVGTGAVSPQLLLLSARTASALEAATANLADHLETHSEVPLGDVAYTLRVGRARFDHRRMLVCADAEDARAALAAGDPRRLRGAVEEAKKRPVVFMFSGQGSQHPSMAAELYRREPAFRSHLDECLDLLEEAGGLDLRPLLHPPRDRIEAAAERLEKTGNAQPALFAVEHSLARLWMEWGVHPEAMIGHSIGEYVAACLAGVFSLRDGLKLVAERGRLMQALPGGSMVSLPLAAEEVEPLLDEGLSIAAMNAPSLTVVSGPDEAVEALEERLAEKGIAYRRLHTSHAFHSPMMEPILEAFAERVAAVRLSSPQIPYVSNVGGSWITASEATDPGYWARHLRAPVRFADGLSELAASPERVLLEVGPGQALATLARQQQGRPANRVAVASLGRPGDDKSDLETLLGAWGQLWLAGADVGRAPLHAGEGRLRADLPTYPFERERYWIDLPDAEERAAPERRGRSDDLADWFFLPSWKRSVPLATLSASGDATDGSWLIFTDRCGLGEALAGHLRRDSCEVFTVRAGDGFEARDDGDLSLAPARRADYLSLLAELEDRIRFPLRIVHLWAVTGGTAIDDGAESCERQLELGFYSLLRLLRAIGERGLKDEVELTVVADGQHAVLDDDRVDPAQATVLGPCCVAPAEYPNVSTKSIDVVVPSTGGERERLAASLVAEVAAGGEQTVVAFRGDHRWLPAYEPLWLEPKDPAVPALRQGGVCLITGGLGGIGLTVARHLAETAAAKLVLVARTPLPPREKWSTWLEEHPAADETSAKIRQLEAVEDLGGEVVVVSADVADRKQMQAALALAEERFGGIHGVVHAAGVAGGGLIQLKSSEMAAQVLAPKVTGTLVLDDLLAGRELDLFVLCSSLTAILGGVGQVDYCAANAFLDAFAEERSRRNGDDGSTVSICWDAWAEVGMAVEAAQQHRHPLAASPPDGTSPGSGENGGRGEGRRESSHPLFDRFERSGDGAIFSAELTPDRHWVLGEHRIAGTPALVGTAYLEMGRAAFAGSLGADAGARLEEVIFMQPLTVGEGQRRQVETVLRSKNGEDSSFVVRSRAAGAGSQAWQEHAVGRIGTVGRTESPRRVDVAEVAARCDREVIELSQEGSQGVDGGGEVPAGVSFGPRWKCLREIRVGDGEALGRLELPQEFAADEEEFFLHPALLDLATSFPIARLGGGGFYLPFAYGRVVARGPLRGKLYSHVRFSGDGEGREAIKVDVSILDQEGVERVEIRGFTMKRVDEKLVQAMAAGRGPVPGAGATADGAEDRGATAVVALAGLEDAIRPEEGAEVFRRTVERQGFSRVIVSTRPFGPRLEGARRATSARLLEQMEKRSELAEPLHARPSVRTEFVAPRNELEEGVAEIWQRVLGIEKVGVHDDFIELGGHSLLAIQVISQLREAYEVDLPVDVILNSPTVAMLSEAIMQAMAEVADEGLLAEALDEAEGLAEAEGD